jgi:hypothetical protein
LVLAVRSTALHRAARLEPGALDLGELALESLELSLCSAVRRYPEAARFVRSSGSSRRSYISHSGLRAWPGS